LSKQSKRTAASKRPKKIVYFLDRNLCCEALIQPLRDAGYNLVTYAEEYGSIYNQRIPDPEIIAKCGERKHILVTVDRKMEYTYAAEIYKARVGIVLLLTNNDGASSWKNRLLLAQKEIRKQIDTRRKPYLIRVALDGKLTKIRLYRKNNSQNYWID
jgi:hypothetical protein